MVDLSSLKAYAHTGIPPNEYVLRVLKEYIGHSNWFISGSFANKYIENPKDIDVFFLTDKDFLLALEHSGFNGTTVLVETGNAHTVHMKEIPLAVQFIKRNVGTPEQIFENFDLNICKRAILPDGTYVVDKTADAPISICKLNYNTFNRYLNYMYATENTILSVDDKVLTLKSMIDRYISDSTTAVCYYEGSTNLASVNKTMFDAFIHEHYVEDYLLEQAFIHAPELLV